MFNEKDKLLIRFEEKLKNKEIEFESKLTNDWKVDYICNSEVSIISTSLAARLNLKISLFMELMNASVLRNGIFEGNYRPLRYLGDFYLLKEGSEDYNIALNNSKSKKLVLKTGMTYDLYLKSAKLVNIKSRSRYVVNEDNIIRDCIFLGSGILGSGGMFSNQLKVRTNTEPVFLFMINKQIYWFKKRAAFDIIAAKNINVNFTDKNETFKNVNELLLEQFKINFERHAGSNFEVLFLSEKDFKNSLLNGNDLFLEKSKNIVLKFLNTR